MRWREAWSRWQRVLGVAVGLAALAMVAAQLWRARDPLDGALRGSEPAGIALAILIAMLAQSMFALGWLVLLRQASATGGHRHAFASWCFSLGAKYLPGKVWQALVRKTTHGAAAEVILPLYLREQLIAVGVALLFVALQAPRALPAAYQSPFQVGALLAGLAVLAASASAWLPAITPQWLRRWWGQRPTPRAMVLAIVANMAAYALLALGLLVLLRATSLPAVGLMELASGLCLGGLAGLLVFFVPAGLGIREAGLYWFLTPAIGAGPAALAAILSRAWLMAADLGMVLLGAALARFLARGR